MIKTALSASLIALAVLAPAASAAPEPKAKPEKEPKAPLMDDKTAKYCADIAAIKADKKGNITLTKEQLAFQSKFDCPVEEPKDCPAEYAKTGSSSHKAEWLKQGYKSECSVDKPEKGKHETKPEKPFDPSVIGRSKVKP